LPLLSGLPAIFHVFLGVLTSFPHKGHLAIYHPFPTFTWDEHKTFSIATTKISQITPLPVANNQKKHTSQAQANQSTKNPQLFESQRNHGLSTEKQELESAFPIVTDVNSSVPNFQTT
jgi:hypothetical protein